MNSLLLINKPIGLSTFDLIRHLKKAIKPDFKVGHAGTLDVFADGLVVLLLGDATKTFTDFQEHPKTYLATARLGISSPTLDIEGELTIQKNYVSPGRETIEQTIKDFPQKYDQTVPSYSAAKHQGKPLYKHARSGKLLTKTKPVTIHNLELVAHKNPLVTFKATTSSGTYIRQLSYDLFRKLEIDSFLSNLTRTEIGPYKLQNAATLEDLYNQNWKQYLVTIC